MSDPPAPVQWSRHPLKEAPGRGLLVLLILLLVSSLVLHTLGASAASTLLIVVFLFSLRDFILPTSVLVDEAGLSVSAPLTGSRLWTWEALSSLESRADGLWLAPAKGRRRRLPAPSSDAQPGLDAWMIWWKEDRECGVG